MTLFKDRLREAIGEESIRSFSRRCSICDTTIRQYLSGKSDHPMAFLIAMADCADVGFEWLATGKGSKAVNKKYIAPCPFCGATKVLLGSASGEEPYANPYWYCECDLCGAVGPFMEDEASALARWNHRQ